MTIPFSLQAANVVLKNGDRITGLKDLGHGSAFRVNADQGIRVKITQNWRVNFEYDIRYNSLPVSGLNTTDTNIIFGFSYDFKP